MNDFLAKISVLETFNRSLDQSAFVLKEDPELTFPQIYNRTQWKAKKNELLKKKLETEEKNFKKPWIKLQSRPLENSALIRTLTGHTSYVLCCAFSPNGECIVSGGYDKTIKIWSADTGKEINSISTPEPAWLCAFSPDGKYIISGNRRKKLWLWNVESGKEITYISDNEEPEWMCNLGLKGEGWQSESWEEALSKWNSGANRGIRNYVNNNDLMLFYKDIALSPDKKKVITGTKGIKNKILKLWDTETKELFHILPGHKEGPVYACGFSPSGEKIISCSEDKTLILWDANTGKQINTYTGHTSRVSSCHFNPNGKTFVSGSWDFTLKIWDAEVRDDDSVIKGHADQVYVCKYSPDEKKIITACRDGTIKIWNAKTRKVINTLTGYSSMISACEFSPDGKWIITKANYESLKIWNTHTGVEIATLVDIPEVIKSHGWSILPFDFSPDSRILAYATLDNDLIFWDTEKHEIFNTLSGHEQKINTIKFSLDSKIIVTGSEDGIIKIWNVQTGALVRTLHAHKNTVNTCTFSSNGDKFITGSKDGTVKIWNIRDGFEIFNLNISKKNVIFSMFLQDGKKIITTVSGMYDTFSIWDIDSRKELICIEDLLTSYDAVGYTLSNDEKIIVSGSKEKTLKVWDTNTGNEIAPLKGLTGYINACDLNKNGKQIIFGDSLGMLLFATIENIE